MAASSSSFFNSDGDIAPEVAQALPEVGLRKEAEIVKQCMDLFPSPYPVDRNRRRDLMLRNGEAIDKKLREMSDLVDSVTIRRAMIDLARRGRVAAVAGQKFSWAWHPPCTRPAALPIRDASV